MTSTSPHQLRVAAPTLEPDPVLLAMLAEASAHSSPTSTRTVRPAGFRMLVAAASVAVIATATWAGGQNAATPLKPVAPATQVPTSSPTNGDVGTPQPDVATTPGGPTSPGLPGTTSADSERAADDARTGLPGNSAGNRKDERGDQQRAGKGKGRGTLRRPSLTDAPERSSDWLGGPFWQQSAPSDDGTRGERNDRGKARRSSGDRDGNRRGRN